MSDASENRRGRPRRGRRSPSLGSGERLECRVALAADWPVSPTGPRIGVDAVAIWNAPPPVAAAAPLTASALLATVAPYADTLFGDTQAVVVEARAVARDLAPLGREFRTELPVAVSNVPLAATVRLEVLSGLTAWDGRGASPAFRPVSRGLEINLQASGIDLRVGADSDRGLPPQGGQIRRSMTLAASDGQPLDRRIAVTIGNGGVADRFTRPGAAPGLYAFTGLLSIGGVDTIRPSQPVTFVFRVGAVADSAVAAALAGFTAPATRPAAVLAVAGRVAGVDRAFSDAILITIDYSDPVTVSRQSPQLPLSIDGMRRLATLPADGPRTNVRQLTFSYVPVGRETTAAGIEIGTSLLLPPGASIRTAGGTAAITSLPSAGSRGMPLDFRAAIVHVTADITRNTTFRAGTTYVITTEVHVTEGATLTIEDGVRVLIRNGRITGRTLTAAALVFDSGSRLRAASVSFAAADSLDRQAASAQNGGVFFCGTFRTATKDGITNRAGVGVRSSSFVADRIEFSFLGRPDPLAGEGDARPDDRDDIDAVSLLGIGPSEWRVREVSSTNSGDDGFDVTNSSVSLATLTVVNPTEDGLNVTSSIVEVTGSCTVAMSRSPAADRELFDLETDQGPARIVFQRLAAIDLRGYWGDRYDEVRLNARDMPQPNRRAKEWYEFVGVLRAGPAVVYSINAD